MQKRRFLTVSFLSACITVATRDAAIRFRAATASCCCVVFFRAGENKLFTVLEDRQLQPVIRYGVEIPVLQVTARDKASTGVCTRPSEWFFLFAAMPSARLALYPMIRSASLRALPARYRPS